MRLRNAVEIIGAVVVAVGGAILFALGYRSRNFGLGEAKSDLADAQSGQRESAKSADAIADGIDKGTRGIDDAQKIVERDGKLIDEAQDIFAKYK